MWVECLSSKCETLNSNPRVKKKKKRESNSLFKEPHSLKYKDMYIDMWVEIGIFSLQ
jgi:hypothetical protein